jgi:NAD(P)-dependent dehydrogenase (short-subunit alcohol dehydrogenase family)
LIPPEDIAGVYLFLASPAGSEITGQALSVDRGASIF